MAMNKDEKINWDLMRNIPPVKPIQSRKIFQYGFSDLQPYTNG
jgi:hypothetical protein